MKRLSFFILALAILFLAVPAVQAADYALLKSDYIKAHPGQAIIPFPWEPITSVKVLPFNYEIPAAPGNTLSVTACRDEFEPASFILNARKDLSGITISVPTLSDTKGNTIPSSALDVRLVKVWYQAASDSVYIKTAGHYLTPELLLKDDSLVKVDYGTKTNYLKVTLNGVQQYIDISSPTAAVPRTAQVRDATSLQPFSLKANENKQVWITVHVPGSTPAGKYSGTITINAPSEPPVTMSLSVTVLPFTLEPAPLEYAIFYQGDLNPYFVGIEDSDKTTANMVLELQDLKDHGIAYPTLYWHTTEFLDQSLTLRERAGFPKDKIYTHASSVDTQIGNPTDAAGLAHVAKIVKTMRNFTESHGYANTFFFGIDEAMGAEVTAQRTAWQTVHANGGKMYVAGDKDLIDLVPDLLDLVVLGGSPDTTQVARWHSYGKRIYSYGDPQAGIENPEIYRKNYGVTLWNAGYDGTMPFSYQHKYDDIWNDFDSPETHFRDHVFAYPTNNGVIDTIQWEGFREGVDDTRYVASLIKKVGSTSARTIIANSLSQGTSMATIRKNVINQILSYTSASIPTPTPTPTQTPTPAPTQPSVASVMVTTPNGGESWVRGTTPTIRWTSSGSVGSSVKIELMKAGVVSQTISASTPNDGTFTSWTIPSTLATGTDYRIRITSTTNTAIRDTSNNYFTITAATTPSPAAITVSAPNGGETWMRGNTPTIKWTSSGSVGSYVKVELMKAGVVSQTISASTPNDGTFTSWTIPSTLATGTDYRIRITSTTNTAIRDTSNNYFTITAATTPSPAAITVSAPNGGETWMRGNTPTIKWTSSGSVGSYVKVELMKAGVVSQTISASTPNDGTFTSWTIPSTLATGTDYRIRITSTTNTAIRDTSNNYFTIAAATTASPADITVSGFG